MKKTSLILIAVFLLLLIVVLLSAAKLGSAARSSTAAPGQDVPGPEEVTAAVSEAAETAAETTSAEQENAAAAPSEKVNGYYSSRGIIKPVADGLYQLYVAEINDDIVSDYFRSMDEIFPGTGLAVKAGDAFGRVYDCGKDVPEIVIITRATFGHRASVSVSSLPMFDEQKLFDGLTELEFRLLPWFAVEGLNDAGVFCAINSVYPDHGTTTGTAPEGPDLCVLQAVRYVLDNAVSASDAVALLSSRNIYAPLTADGGSAEYSLFIADERESYVVEFYDNALVIRMEEPGLADYFLSDGVPNAHPFGVTRLEDAVSGIEAPDPAELEALLSSLNFPEEEPEFETYLPGTEEFKTAHICIYDPAESTVSVYGKGTGPVIFTIDG